jgi:hypothetical protein
MNYKVFTNESLVMMHHGACGALAVDDELHRLSLAPRFQIRETPDWKKHAENLETEMARRGMIFDKIDWCETQRVACASDADQSPALSQREACSSPTDPAALLSKRIAAIVKR